MGGEVDAEVPEHCRGWIVDAAELDQVRQQAF